MPRQRASDPPASRDSQAARDASRGHVEAVLLRLHERRIEREQELSNYPTTRPHDVESECTDWPHFDKFRDIGGSAAIEDMTNFTTREFNELWLSVRDYVVVNYNVGRGRGTWQSLSDIFNIPTTSFTDVVTKFIEILAPKLFVDQVQQRADSTKMRVAVTSGNTFNHFPCALYAVDVTFQQSWRPRGSIQENGKYYSGKHHLYGLKVEVSVDTRGFAIDCSEHAKGATHDITMFKNNKAFHQSKMKKLPGDDNLLDQGPLKDKFPDEWAILADKGFQGMASYLRCIHPKKGRSLSRTEQANNDKISSDRVLVENYFGRFNMLWRITADKFRWEPPHGPNRLVEDSMDSTSQPTLYSMSKKALARQLARSRKLALEIMQQKLEEISKCAYTLLNAQEAEQKDAGEEGGHADCAYKLLSTHDELMQMLDEERQVACELVETLELRSTTESEYVLSFSVLLQECC
ncbi:hypothetical protein BBJ28_00025704, partial [Nothophytophthora sp. Chile5]